MKRLFAIVLAMLVGCSCLFAERIYSSIDYANEYECAVCNIDDAEDTYWYQYCYTVASTRDTYQMVVIYGTAENITECRKMILRCAARVNEAKGYYGKDVYIEVLTKCNTLTQTEIRPDGGKTLQVWLSLDEFLYILR